jgi:hypothetical protein
MMASLFDIIRNAASNPILEAANVLAEAIEGTGAMSPEQLVKTITEGHGPDGLAAEQQEHLAKARVQDQIMDETRQHMTTLESAWTGAGADAAREKLQTATTPVANSSQAMTANAGTISAQIDAFTALKNSLHTDVTDAPPEKGLWDSLTPWDTDTEKAINENNAKAMANRQAFDNYMQTSQSSAPQIKTDYGQVTNLTGGSFEIQQQPPLPPDKPGPDHPGHVGHTSNTNTNSTTTNSNSNQRSGTSNVSSATTQNTRDSVGTTRNTTGGKLGDGIATDPNNFQGDVGKTRTSGYTSPDGVGSTYQPGNYNYNSPERARLAPPGLLDVERWAAWAVAAGEKAKKTPNTSVRNIWSKPTPTASSAATRRPHHPSSASS